MTVVSTTHTAVRVSGRQYIKRTEESEMSEREYATVAGVNDLMCIWL